MISFPAPAEPPIRATIKLGIIAKHLVKKFLSHGFILNQETPEETRNRTRFRQEVRTSGEFVWGFDHLHYVLSSICSGYC